MLILISSIIVQISNVFSCRCARIVIFNLQFSPDDTIHGRLTYNKSAAHFIHPNTGPPFLGAFLLALFLEQSLLDVLIWFRDGP